LRDLRTVENEGEKDEREGMTNRGKNGEKTSGRNATWKTEIENELIEHIKGSN